MSIMNEIKAGADLTTPKPTSGWIIGASVAVVFLMVAVGIGSYMYRLGKSAISGTSGKVSAGAGDALSGVFGDGT